MTHREIRKSYKEHNPEWKEFLKDKPALQFDFQVYVDMLCKSGQITQKQYENVNLTELK